MNAKEDQLRRERVSWKKASQTACRVFRDRRLRISNPPPIRSDTQLDKLSGSPKPMLVVNKVDGAFVRSGAGPRSLGLRSSLITQTTIELSMRSPPFWNLLALQALSEANRPTFVLEAHERGCCSRVENTIATGSHLS
jgi:hypothetical protein